jgi:hypothetical protein
MLLVERCQLPALFHPMLYAFPNPQSESRNRQLPECLVPSAYCRKTLPTGRLAISPMMFLHHHTAQKILVSPRGLCRFSPTPWQQKHPVDTPHKITPTPQKV